MKLSDIKGERTFDVIADIIEPVANIAQDKAALDLFTKKECPKGVDPKTFTVNRIKKAAPKLLKGHKGDLIAIIAAIKGITPKQYEESLNLATLTQDLLEMVTDEELLNFFSQQQTGQE